MRQPATALKSQSGGENKKKTDIHSATEQRVTVINGVAWY